MKPSSLLCWFLILILPLVAWPQTQPAEANGQPENRVAEDHSSKIRSQVQARGTGEKATVKVTLRDKSIVKGYISQTGPESFRVKDKKSGKVTTISYEDAARVQKSGLSTGAKIGIGVGIVGGVLVAIALGSLAASGE